MLEFLRNLYVKWLWVLRSFLLLDQVLRGSHQYHVWLRKIKQKARNETWLNFSCNNLQTQQVNTNRTCLLPAQICTPLIFCKSRGSSFHKWHLCRWGVMKVEISCSHWPSHSHSAVIIEQIRCDFSPAAWWSSERQLPHPLKPSSFKKLQSLRG